MTDTAIASSAVTTADSPALPPAAETERKRRWGRIALIVGAQLAFGTGLGLGITECVFTQRADGAFPHVNFYVPDAALGVRLEPGAQMRFQLGQNPVSTIHVNASGFRGEDWAPPVTGIAKGQGEIVVVGDSQVFGLGVDDDETFSALLAKHTGRSVINGGVPTYGPDEYLATAEEIIGARKPETLVYVINFVNDPFEIDRPNIERHAVWDGWAVRIETAPPSVTQFPGRKWLFQRSHAFYAARRWWYDIEFDAEGEAEHPIDVGTPSEGGWFDLVDQGRESAQTKQQAIEAAEAAHEAKIARLAEASGELKTAEEKIDDGLCSDDGLQWCGDLRAEIARGRPGDIVSESFAESSREVFVTAALFRKATRERNRRVERALARESRKGKSSKVTDAVAKREALTEEVATLRAEVTAAPQPPPRPQSVFKAHLDEVKAMTDAHGVELVVVSLPIDVQVSSDEWAKYGVEQGEDMSASLVLLDDLVATTEAMGATAVNPTEALRAAEPGAFLHGDIHMTAKGHAALAEALAEKLGDESKTGKAATLAMPSSGLPRGVNPVPQPDAWARAGQVVVTGSSKAGCRTQIVASWFWVRCAKQRKRSKAPTGVEILTGRRPEVMTLATGDAVSLLTPLTAGQDIVARFHWEDRSRDLFVTWPADAPTDVGGKPHFSAWFEPSESPETPPPTVDERTAALCRCHQEHTREHAYCKQDGGLDTYDAYVLGCERSCRELYGHASGSCFDTFDAAMETDCEKLLACVRGDPLAAPTCPPGQYLVQATNTCVAPCDADHPCQTGTCVDYRGGGICQ